MLDSQNEDICIQNRKDVQSLNSINFDRIWKQLINEAGSKATTIDRRFEIRKQLTDIRRLKRKMKEQGMCV
ncbi:hypothetical protein PMSD_04925 [Paenibacillus macquariensis subsp. defensor]|nr:hypothetical protein PMSD_04925 [Paenibacillus macquariensis subsp. defensor]